jgi:NAD(P)-dependent dehydrogenase (short-subunit alcohol dehydrogenase family)
MQPENKVAIVTGAASGIGKGIAALFARQGAKVVIADLNKRGADAAAAELGGAKRAIGVAVDVTDEAATANCVAQTVAAFGGVDILVSNAGIQTVAPIDQFDFGKWKQLLARTRQCHLPRLVRTPLVDKQIPEQAKELGISEQEVIKHVMLKETVDGDFTTIDDVAQTALFLASFGSNALTGQSVVVSHGWFMR